MELFNYNFFLALHIISMVSWMAGLFYVVRLFVYHSEIIEKRTTYGESEDNALHRQLSIMEQRLLSIIASPAMVLTVFFGFYLAIYSDAFYQSWLHWKLMVVTALVFYHFYAIGVMLKLRQGKAVLSSRMTRVFNEVAPILFIAIVFLVSLKEPQLAMQATAGVVVIVLAIYGLVLGVKALRKSSQ